MSSAAHAGLSREVALVDLVDRLLGAGVVVSGELVISLAGVDLVYVNLRALLASADTALGGLL
jgi:hypothetical protein